MQKPAWTLDSAAFTKIKQALGTHDYTAIAAYNHYYKYEQRHGRDDITIGTSGTKRSDRR